MGPEAGYAGRDSWRVQPDFDEPAGPASFRSISPWSSKHMDKCSLLRSVTHGDADHASAAHYLLTGYEPTAGLPANEMPSYGSIVAKERGPRRPGLPAYVAVPEAPASGMAAYLGAAYNPYTVGGDPGQADYSVRNLTLPSGISLSRLEDRTGLLTELDTLRRDVDGSGLMDGIDVFNRTAYEMVTGPAARQAFDLSKESDKTRDRYGRTGFGQSLLMARRLVEAGVTFVTVKSNGWDTHSANFSTLKNSKLPELDQPVGRGAGGFGRTRHDEEHAGEPRWENSAVPGSSIKATRDASTGRNAIACCWPAAG